MRTTWRTNRDPAQVLDLLRERLGAAQDVTAVDRDGATLVVRSRAVPTRAHLLSVLLPPPLPFKSLFMRARTERVLRITAVDRAQDRTLELEGDANEGVSRVLVATSHELFPEKAAAWDDE
jgi:hypothetical protein